MFNIQINKNQMVRDHVNAEDDVLFSTSYGPYIPRHILQHAAGRYWHGRLFFDDFLHPTEQQFEKGYYLNSICLFT
jgi:hypothetical protein